jgi:signal transduction histidine kinase
VRYFVRRIAFSLRGKLLLFSLALVVVPGLVFGGVTLTSTRRALERAVGRQLAEVAQDNAAELSEFLLRERATMRSWATQEVMREARIGDIDKHISRFLVSMRQNDIGFLELACVDTTGRVVAASDPALLGGSQGEQDWWRVVKAGGELLAGPRLHTGTRRVLEIAVPLLDPERPAEVQGGLLGLFDWDRLTAVSARVQRTSRRHKFRVDIALVDSRGLVIAEAPPLHGPVLLGQNLRDVGWRSARRLPAAQPGYWRDLVPDSLVGFAPVPAPRADWTVLVRQPLSEAFAAAYRLQRRLALLLAGILLAAMGVALLFAERLGRPLRQLTRATRTLATTGAVPKPIAVRSRDEIGVLAHAFNRMAVQLQRAQSDLVTAAKFAFVGEVAAGVAHEVRTPLGILRSSAQLLRRKTKDSAETAELVDMIVGEVDRLDRVVAQLLELARPRQPLIESTPLAALLMRALDFVSAGAAESGVIVEHDFTTPMRAARCDPEQMYQVALNLIVNALQVMSGGGRLSVCTMAGGNGRVGFTVSDTGPGMPADVLDRIFTPFFTRRPGGTGLGLAFVQRTVQAHHGRVDVVSELGRGTTFHVELPAAEEKG